MEQAHNARVTENYDKWMAEGAHSFPVAGNKCAPPRPEIAQWFLEAKDGLNRELLVCSFRSCPLTVDPDGSQNDQTHCLTRGQLCHAGLDRPTSIQQAVSASRAN